MLTRLRASAFLLFCLISSGLVSKADGCVCGGSWEGIHPCLLYRAADVVFLGLVVNIGEMTPLNDTHDGQRIYTMRDVIVQLSIEEGFRGVNGQTIDLYLMGTSCDFGFQKGERYFVYASRDPSTKKLHAGSCSGTKPLAYAVPDLAYARGAARGAKDPDAYGNVMRQVRTNASDYAQPVGIPGVRVVLESREHSISVLTNSEGRFEIAGLPAGRYKARPELPDNLRITYRTEREIEVGSGQCTGIAFVATSLGRINGRLVDPKGTPVAETPIYLVPIDANNKAIVSEVQYEAFTEKDGHYVFEWLSQGRYLIAINPHAQPRSSELPYRRTYYRNAPDPAQATVITLSEGQDVTLEDFPLPPRLVETRIEGSVLWPDGHPATQATVELEFTEQHWSEGLKQVDELGRFSLKCYEGFKYLVHAEVRVPGRPMHAAPVEVLAGKENKPITLIIDQQGFDTTHKRKK